MTELGHITRDHPSLSRLQADVRHLQDVWTLYQDWKVNQQRFLDSANRLNKAAPTIAETVTKQLGTEQDVSEAGELIQTSLDAYLQALEKHDLTTARDMGDLTATDLEAVTKIRQSRTREKELAALSRSHDEPERER